MAPLVRSGHKDLPALPDILEKTDTTARWAMLDRWVLRVLWGIQARMGRKVQLAMWDRWGLRVPPDIPGKMGITELLDLRVHKAVRDLPDLLARMVKKVRLVPSARWV